MKNNKAIQVLNRILDNYHRLCNEHLLTEGMVAEEIEALEMALNNLKVTRWIPCSERLPNIEVLVLVYTKDSRVLIAELLEDTNDYDEYCGYWCSYEESLEFELDRVIAWMPLPEPYKEIKQ